MQYEVNQASRVADDGAPASPTVQSRRAQAAQRQRTLTRELIPDICEQVAALHALMTTAAATARACRAMSDQISSLQLKRQR